MSIISVSCNGQHKTYPSKDSINHTSPKLFDNDLYFISSSTVVSSIGLKNITRNILQDKNGLIWFVSWEGIISFDGSSFINMTNKDSLRPYHVFSLIEDNDGNPWFGTIGAEVYFYNGKTFTNFTTKEGLANNRVGCIAKDKA